jgi:hypothetical protein
MRRAAVGMLLAGFGVGLALLALEMAVRLLHLVPTHFWEPDALLGSRLVAGKEGWWTQEEHEFRVESRINSDGWRDVERPRVKPPGTFRILVLGDSFIEALQVPLEKTFARLLEAELGNGPVEVLSMGVSGYGTATELLLYRECGRSYGPDLVLLAFYPGNDVRNNSPVLEPVLRPIYDRSGRLERVSATRKAAAGQARRRGFLGHSAAYQYARKRLITGHPELAERLVALGLLGRGALASPPTVGGVPVDYLVYSAEPSPDWEDAWRRTFVLLASLRSAVEADGARLAVVVVTAREQIYPEDWRQVLGANPAMASMQWELQGPERRLMRWCEATGVPCLRLSPAFEEAAANGPRLHFLHDGHWTEAGHALAARTVAGFLRTERLYPEMERSVGDEAR